MKLDLGERRRMLGQGPTVGGGELARINETRICSACVYPFANAIGAPEIVSKPIEVVNNPGLLCRKARIVAAPEEWPLPHLEVSLSPEVQCILIWRKAAKAAVIMDHRQTEARCEVHYLYRSSLLILFGLHGLQRREALGRGKDPSDRIHGHALGLEEGD